MFLNKCFDFTDFKQLDIAIISDTHADIVADIYQLVNSCDLVIHAGDIGSMEVLKQLRPKMEHVLAVAGNNDKVNMWDVLHCNVVKDLPERVHIKLPGGSLGIEHGHLVNMNKPSHACLRKSHQGARMVVYGHTHHQLIDNSDDQQWVINPGAAGVTRTHGGPSCLKLTIDKFDWKLKTYRF